MNPIRYSAPRGIVRANLGIMKPKEIYTHGHPQAVVEAHARRTAEVDVAYARHLFFEGARVLDVGCGPGTISVGLANWVGSGEVVAIDLSEAVLESARERAGTVANLRFEMADVYRLPFEDGSFDVAHAHQVLQHLGEPVAALREMQRIVKSGGAIAVRDGDFETFTHHPYDPMLARWREVYRQVARANGGEPDAGRRLLEWALLADLEVESVAGTSWVFASEQERAWWGELWAARTLAPHYADRAIATGATTMDELEEIAEAWRRWAVVPHGYHGLLITELVGRVVARH